MRSGVAGVVGAAAAGAAGGGDSPSQDLIYSTPPILLGLPLHRRASRVL